MEKFFSPEEQHFLRGVTLSAFVHTSKALQRMLHSDIIPEHFAVRKGQQEVTSLINHLKNFKTGEVKVLRTSIVGDIKGETYVFITPDVEKQICKALLPASNQGRPEFREGMLLELDNILIAALVTKFSEYLQVNINGHVPNYDTFNEATIAEIAKFYTNDQHPLRFTTTLYSMKSDLKIPIFGAVEGEPLKSIIQNLIAARKGKSIGFDEIQDLKNSEQNKKKKGIFDKIFKWE